MLNKWQTYRNSLWCSGILHYASASTQESVEIGRIEKKPFGKHGLAEHDNQLKGEGLSHIHNKHKTFHWKAV
jgi:hypothetical protein